MKTKPRIIHIRKDGTVCESMKGVEITCKEYYQVLKKHQEAKQK